MSGKGKYFVFFKRWREIDLDTGRVEGIPGKALFAFGKHGVFSAVFPGERSRRVLTGRRALKLKQPSYLSGSRGATMIPIRYVSFKKDSDQDSSGCGETAKMKLVAWTVKMCTAPREQLLQRDTTVKSGAFKAPRIGRSNNCVVQRPPPAITQQRAAINVPSQSAVVPPTTNCGANEPVNGGQKSVGGSFNSSSSEHSTTETAHLSTDSRRGSRRSNNCVVQRPPPAITQQRAAINVPSQSAVVPPTTNCGANKPVNGGQKSVGGSFNSSSSEHSTTETAHLSTDSRRGSRHSKPEDHTVVPSGEQACRLNDFQLWKKLARQYQALSRHANAILACRYSV